MAVNIDVNMPMDNVTANPATGPLPIVKRIKATNSVVMFASIIRLNWQDDRMSRGLPKSQRRKQRTSKDVIRAVFAAWRVIDSDETRSMQEKADVCPRRPFWPSRRL